MITAIATIGSAIAIYKVTKSQVELSEKIHKETINAQMKSSMMAYKLDMYTSLIKSHEDFISKMDNAANMHFSIFDEGVDYIIESKDENSVSFCRVINYKILTYYGVLQSTYLNSNLLADIFKTKNFYSSIESNDVYDLLNEYKELIEQYINTIVIDKVNYIYQPYASMEQIERKFINVQTILIKKLISPA
jgi:hypothetical protein